MLVIIEYPLPSILSGLSQININACLSAVVLIEMQITILQIFNTHESQHVRVYLKLLLFEHWFYFLFLQFLQIFKSRITMWRFLFQLASQLFNFYS